MRRLIFFQRNHKKIQKDKVNAPSALVTAQRTMVLSEGAPVVSEGAPPDMLADVETVTLCIGVDVTAVVAAEAVTTVVKICVLPTEDRDIVVNVHTHHCFLNALMGRLSMLGTLTWKVLEPQPRFEVRARRAYYSLRGRTT